MFNRYRDNNEMGIEKSRNEVNVLIVIVALFMGLIMISPIFYLLGISTIYLSISALILIFLIMLLENRKVSVYFYYISFLVVAFSYITVIRWDLPVLSGLEPIRALTSLLILMILKEKEVDVFVRYATYIIIAILIITIIGYIHWTLFKSSFLVMSYYGDEQLKFYFTTFITVNKEGFIRSSGIYDEPGALSFVVCSIATLRFILCKNYKTTWLILFLGLITFSLAHIIYMFIYFILEKNKTRNIGLMLIFLCLAYFLNNLYFSESSNELILNRLEINEEGGFVGDNRSERFFNALEYLDFDVFLFGLDKSIFDDYQNAQYRYKLVGENILSPLVTKGLFMSLSYYTVIVLLVYMAVKKRKYIIGIGMIMLLSQRPYVLLPGYSLWAIYPIVLYYMDSRKNKALSGSAISG